MASIYTHDFEVSFATDGSKFIIGEATVDISSKKANHKIISTSEPLPLDFFEDAISLLKQIEALFVKYERVKKVEFKLK